MFGWTEAANVIFIQINIPHLYISCKFYDFLASSFFPLLKKITKEDFLTAQEADMSINSKRMSYIFKFDELERRNVNFF